MPNIGQRVNDEKKNRRQIWLETPWMFSLLKDFNISSRMEEGREIGR